MIGNGGKLDYFLGGLGIGAVAAVLFAPRSGEESRDYLNQRVEEGKEYARRKALEIRERAEDFTERGKQIVAEQREVVSKAVEAGRDLVERGRQIVAEQKEVISKAVEAGRDVYRRDKSKESI